MAQRRTPPRQRDAKQMGQSGTGRQHQGTLHPPRQSGTGTTSVKRQQTAQDVQRTDESEMRRERSNRRQDDVVSDDEDIERAGLTRESGLDDESR